MLPPWFVQLKTCIFCGISQADFPKYFWGSPGVLLCWCSSARSRDQVWLSMVSFPAVCQAVFGLWWTYNLKPGEFVFLMILDAHSPSLTHTHNTHITHSQSHSLTCACTYIHTHKLTHHHPSITLILPLPLLLFYAQSKSREVGNMSGYPVL